MYPGFRKRRFRDFVPVRPVLVVSCLVAAVTWAVFGWL